MMMSEERRLEAGQVKETLLDSGAARLSKHASYKAPQESDSDFTPAGFVLQDQLPFFIAFLHHSSVTMRFAALELLGTLLRQGMLCPLDVIGPLISIQADADFLMRKESLKILQTEEHKHPNFFDNRMLEGVELSFDLQVKMSGKATAVDEDGNCIFDALYTACISDRRRRSDFLLGLLRRCLSHSSRYNEDCSENSLCMDATAITESTQQLEKVAYYASLLASLGFETVDEPLLAIYWMGRNLPVVSALYSSHMKTLFSQMGVRERAEGLMQAPAEGALPRSKQPPARRSSKTNVCIEEGLVFDSAEFNAWFRLRDKQTIQRALNDLTQGIMVGQSLEILLRLKDYLKVQFNLSDERCASFSPEDKISGEKARGLEMSIPFRPLEVPSFKPLCDNSFSEEELHLYIRSAAGHYNRLHALLESGGEDFTMSSTKKRVRRGSKIVASGEGMMVAEIVSEKRKPAKLAKKRKKKSKQSSSEDEDSEGSPDDYAYDVHSDD